MAIALSIAAAVYGYRELTRDSLVIEPISVPRPYADAGISPEVMANLVKDVLTEIQAATESIIQKEHLAMRSDEISAINVEVPGTKLGLKTVIEISRTILPFFPQPKSVGGEITLSASTKSSAQGVTPQDRIQNNVHMTLRFRRGANLTKAITIYPPAGDSDTVARSAAEAILGEVNPYVLGAYWLEHGAQSSAVAVAQSMLANPLQDRLHRKAAYYLWGLALDEEKKYDEAIIKFQKAIELDPRFAEAYNNWGFALHEEKKYDEAAIKFQKAIELDPKYAYAYSGWGAALYYQKKCDEAIIKFQKAIELDPKDAIAYNDLGFALEDQKKYDEAIVKFQKAIELDAKLATAYGGWGLALYDQEKYDEANTKFQKATELDPKYAIAYNNWGFALHDQKKYDEAIIKFQKAIELDPKLATAYNGWGSALYYQKKYDEAIIKYQKAIELDPRDAIAYNNWGFALNKLGRVSEAQRKYAKSHDLWQENKSGEN